MNTGLFASKINERPRSLNKLVKHNANIPYLGFKGEGIWERN